MEHLSAYEYLGDMLISTYSEKNFRVVSGKVFLVKETRNRVILTLHGSVAEPVAEEMYHSYCI